MYKISSNCCGISFATCILLHAYSHTVAAPKIQEPKQKLKGALNLNFRPFSFELKKI